MKIFIISDSHGHKQNVMRLHSLMEKGDKLFFLGDGLDDLEELSGDDILKVAGNCDFISFEPYTLTPTIEGVKFFLTHGHLDHVKMELYYLCMAALEKGARVVCFGHTHRPLMEYDYGMLMINPGSLASGSYAIVEIKDGEVSSKLMKLS